MSTEWLKKQAAEAVLSYIQPGSIVGFGSGSTVQALIKFLPGARGMIRGAVSSSVSTSEFLNLYGISSLDLNEVGELELYIDGADEINEKLELIKGKGGALTREKILASASKQFICIADQTKWVGKLGKGIVPVEVIPMAQVYVENQLIQLGGRVLCRGGFLTDNGNIILDVEGLEIECPVELEKRLNNIAGTVSNGLFAQRCADLVVLATESGINTIKKTVG